VTTGKSVELKATLSYFDRCSVTHCTYNYRLWIVAKWFIIGPQLTIDLIGNHA